MLGIGLGLSAARQPVTGGAVAPPPATVPGDMAAPAVVATGQDSISITLSPPPNNDGGSPIIRYDVQWFQGGGDPEIITGAASVTDLSGLLPGTTYLALVRAVNAIGPGPWSSTGSATTLSEGEDFEFTPYIDDDLIGWTGTPIVGLIDGDEHVLWQFEVDEDDGDEGSGDGDPGVLPHPDAPTPDLSVVLETGVAEWTVTSDANVVSGLYANGDFWVANPDPGDGISIDAAAPASVMLPQTYTSAGPAGSVTTDRWRHGMMTGTHARTFQRTSWRGAERQGADSATEWVVSDGAWSIRSHPQVTLYLDSFNVDPGATGAPITLAAGVNESFCKFVTVEDAPAAARKVTTEVHTVTVVATAPDAGAIRPGFSAPSKVSRLNVTDIDFDLLPSLTLPESAISTDAARAVLRMRRFVERGNARVTQHLQPDGLPTYGRDYAERIGAAALVMCGDISSAIKEELAIGFVTLAEDICAALDQGVRWQWVGGLGANHPGFLLPVVMAAAMTGDEKFLFWAEAQEWSAEKRQTFYLDADDIERNSTAPEANRYTAEIHLGMPEYNIQPLDANRPAGGPRTKPLSKDIDASYRRPNWNCYVPQALAMRLVPGAIAAMNHPAFFDYCDRVMDRSFTNEPGSPVGAARSGNNAVSTFTAAMWDSYRASTGAIWNWS